MYIYIYIYLDVYDVYATIHCHVWSVACRQHMTTNANDNDNDEGHDNYEWSGNMFFYL